MNDGSSISSPRKRGRAGDVVVFDYREGVND